jgi:outer membrane lipoprotein-sorting protein
MKTVALALVSMVAATAAQLPAADEIVTRLVEHDNARRASLSGYAVMTRYSLENKSRRAEMLIRWTRQPNGVKQYEIVSEQGDGGVRTHVFHKLLEAEVEASQMAVQERSRITPENYSFRLCGNEVIHGRPAYVLELTPRIDAKYLTRGRIWVDAADFAVIQMEGAPARNVSFWTKSVSFVQTFEKTGEFWLVASNRSVTDARVFGAADLTIEYFQYSFDGLTAKSGVIAQVLVDHQ